jgi:hypothetical protein
MTPSYQDRLLLLPGIWTRGDKKHRVYIVSYGGQYSRVTVVLRETVEWVEWSTGQSSGPLPHPPGTITSLDADEVVVDLAEVER